MGLGNLPSVSPSGIAHVRFYNAASIREPLDIYLNGRLVVSDLDYMNFTRYLHIVPGNYLLTVYQRTNPGGEPIINNRVQFQAGNYYLLSILGGAVRLLGSACNLLAVFSSALFLEKERDRTRSHMQALPLSF